MAARPTDWLDTRLGMTVASGAQSSQSLMGAVSNIEARRYTLIRSLLRLELLSLSTAVAYGVQIVDIGVGIISVEAFTAGVFPDPNVDNDKPAKGWIYRTQVAVSQNGIGTVIPISLTADVRGARKIERGELFIVANSASVVGTTFTIGINGLFRALMKL